MQRIIARGYILSTKNIRFAGISPAKRSRSGQNSVYLDMWRGDNVQEILGAIDPCWPRWGLRRVLADCEFIFCGNPRDLSETSQQPIFTKFSHETSFGAVEESGKTFSKIFNFMGHLPQNLKSKVGQTDITQSRLQVTGCTAERYCVK